MAITDLTRVEQFNQLVRAICVLVLLLAYVAAFLVGVWRNAAIDNGFIGVLTLALTWWFKSRDEKAQAQRDTPTPTPAPSEAPSPSTGRTS